MSSANEQISDTNCPYFLKNHNMLLLVLLNDVTCIFKLNLTMFLLSITMRRRKILRSVHHCQQIDVEAHLYAFTSTCDKENRDYIACFVFRVIKKRYRHNVIFLLLCWEKVNNNGNVVKFNNRKFHTTSLSQNV